MLTAHTATLNKPIRGIDLDSLAFQEPRQRALIIDDEPGTVDLMKLTLTGAGIDVLGADSGASALEKVLRLPPDVILLDIMMPEMDGWETFKRLRGLTNAPVVFISARTGKDDVVRGLQFGADDYITKPFHPAELVARIKATLRRGCLPDNSRWLHFPQAGLHLNTNSQEVNLNDQILALSRREFELLACLAKRAPGWVRREKIAEEVWGDVQPSTLQRIKFLVFKLRRKLEVEPGSPSLILSRENLGYRLAVDANENTETQSSESIDPVRNNPEEENDLHDPNHF